MTMRSPVKLALALLFAIAMSVAGAAVELAPLFRDHGVLQRDKPLPVWGRAEAGERVVVAFGGQSVAGVADAAGRWSVTLKPLAPSAVGAELTARGSTTVTVRDLVVGDVWLCSGQSNMNRSVRSSANAATEIAAGNHPLIRHIRIPTRTAKLPAFEAGGEWQIGSPETVGGFTAVGYYFAREALRELGVPIGLVHASYGGTPIEAWISAEALATDPAFAVVHERWRKGLAEYPAKQAALDERLKRWKAEEAAATEAGVEALADFRKRRPEPRPPVERPGSSWTPCGLYNGMIHPLVPFALRGVLWYQGESNVERAAEYHRLFTALIADWRGRFAQGELPFYWVQLANFNAGDGNARSWAFLREAQAQTLAVRGTGMAVTIDIGEPEDIHPRNKHDVGQRLWLIARAKTYGLRGEYSGPVFEKLERDGPQLRVRFTHATQGLVARGGRVQALEVAGADRVFIPAAATIDGDTVIVSAPEVGAPVAVRYAWKNSPIANLYNGTGLPAAPFRSDDW